jgi:transcriptional regulator with XRE-family HTH domain
MARPRLFEQARKLRLEKGLTQRDAARMLGKSQSYISLLETGQCTLDEERDYLERISKRRANRQRTAGGLRKAGRLRERGVPESAFRGEPLDPGFDHAATLPNGDRWVIFGVCRTAPDTELAFLFDTHTNQFGLVGFHRIDGVVKRGRIIAISAEHDPAASLALGAFANGDLVADEDADENVPLSAEPDDEDGLLGGDTEGAA